MISKIPYNGFSARRKAIPIERRICTTGWIFLIVAAIIVTSCQEKSKGQARVSDKDKTVAVQDSLYKPKVNVKVNRHYDDKGNLVGFDSTYSSYYSNVKGDTSQMDSLMGSFDLFYNKNYAKGFNNQFNRLFFSDSLRYPDFFHDDFFMKRYELNDLYMRDMMHRMDSVKNKFYKERYLNRKTDTNKNSKSKT
jgi:hypothetical protein